ncbi:D-2-hydroxyacid dehydrogenase [bacterium]|nr:D-2-hydroxyacid dehydrogenase [bacterium]MCB2178961.1 D-2-hydroxyacid dehydrogenase [bacterium]
MSEQVQVLVTLPISEELADQISQLSSRISLTVSPAREAADIPDELWEKTQILYTMHTLPEPSQAPNLRWVQSYLSGVEKLLNTPLFTETDPDTDTNQVILTSLSGANNSQVAEHALTMLLALGHQLPTFLDLQHENTWMEEKGKNYIPRELRGSTVGIVGYGSIGRQVARLAHAFGAQVLATKSDLKTLADKGYKEAGMGDPDGTLFTRLYPPQALRSMFKECDFVVVCVPLTKKSTGIIGKTQLQALKPSAFLVDVSRGGVVDLDAVNEALQEGWIAGAALDVFSEEPLPEEHPLWEAPNLIITPHVAGFSPDYNQRANQMFLENLKRYLADESLLNRVDLSRGY